MTTQDDIEYLKRRLTQLERERDEVAYTKAALTELGLATLAGQVHFLSPDARKQLFEVDSSRLHSITERLRHGLDSDGKNRSA